MTSTIDFEEYGRKLYDAAFVDELEDILDDIDDEYGIEWKPLGGKENNGSTVKMLDADFVGGLAELVFNGYDAVLLKAYLQSNLDEPPESIDEAIEKLVDVREEQVKLVADGEKSREGRGRISLSVIDSGIGQKNEDMEETFLDIMTPGVQKKPFGFLQGQYGIGGTACLPHCENGYKLILSASVENPNEWSVGLIRENPDVNVSGYQYMTIAGGVPSFSGTVEGQSHGSVVKLFEYDFGEVGTSKINEKYRFRQLLERYVANPPFGLDIEDRRGFESAATTTTMHGWVNDIEDDIILEESFTIDVPVEHEYFDEVSPQLDVFVTPPESEFDGEWSKDGTRQRRRFVSGTTQRAHAVMLTVNGQMHASLGRSFIRTCNLDAIDNSCVMHLDLSDVPKGVLSELFSSSRNGIVTGSNGKRKAGDALREGIMEALRTDKRIREINRSRTADIGDQLLSPESLDDVMESFAGRSPTLGDAFGGGGDLFSHRGDSSDDVEYNPPDVPPTMNIVDGIPTDDEYDVWDEDEGVYEMEIAADSYGYVCFELPAPIGYFKGKDAEDCRVLPDEVFNSKSLRQGGFLSLRIDAPEAAEEGGSELVRVEVTRPNDDPLEKKFVVNWGEETDDGPGGGGSRGGSRAPSVISGVSLPKPVPVQGRDVRELGMDETDVIRFNMKEGDDSRSEVYVNLEAEVYTEFLKENDLVTSDKREAVDNRYVASVTLLAALKYHSLKSEDAVENEKDVVEAIMSDDARVVLPLAFPDELLKAFD